MSRTVQMLVGMSGTRADGRPWPGKGETLVVDDWEADHLIRGEMARAAGQDDTPPAPPVVAEVHVPAVAEEDDGRPPKPVQPKADWIAYAVSQGLPEQEAAEMTKAQLMETYGGRA